MLASWPLEVAQNNNKITPSLIINKYNTLAYCLQIWRYEVTNVSKQLSCIIVNKQKTKRTYHQMDTVVK